MAKTDCNFDTNWDIYKYKYSYEIDSHWALKEKFFKLNKSKYPENLLVSYAQTFYNMVVLGCSYDEKLMDEVRSMGQEVLDGMPKEDKTGYVSANTAVADQMRSRFNGSWNHRPSNRGYRGRMGRNYPRHQWVSRDFRIPPENMDPAIMENWKPFAQ